MKNCILFSRLFALLPVAVCAAVVSLSGSPLASFTDMVCVAAFSCGTALLMHPLRTENGRVSLCFVASLALVVSVMMVLDCPAEYAFLFMMADLLLYLLFRGACRFRSVSRLLSRSSICESLEHSARSSYVMLFLMTGSVSLLALHDGVMKPVVFMLVSSVSVLLIYRIASGRVFVFRPGLETQIRNIIGREGRSQRPRKEHVTESLFQKVENLMEEKKPFLMDDFCVDDLARMTFSNRTYLSKTINVFSGRNFCGYVNWYRVKYAEELMARDPAMKIIEVAQLSGFGNSTTFNSAFRDMTQETPSDYLRRIRLEQQKKEDR